MSNGVNTGGEARATVLVVDDNPENLEVIGEMLRGAGYRILVARNGARAVERAQRSGPDLILLDVKMPGEDGFSVCERFKAEEVTADIPIIFMTALSDEASKVRGFEVGGVDYVTKPVARGELLARVANHLEIARYRYSLETEVKRRMEETERLAGERGILLETMEAQVWYLTDPDTYGMSNRAHAEFLGLPSERLVNARLESFLPPEVAETCRAGNLEAFQSDRTIFTKEWSKNSFGEDRLLSITKTPRRRPDGRVDQLVCVGVDLTDEYHLRKDLQEQLERNRELLSEVHHRVKNNLAVILSLIHLQMGAVESDEDAIKALKATANRIFAMGAIHESLYQDELNQELRIRNFVQALVNRFADSCETDSTIPVHLDVEDAPISVQTGIPIGMILNELVFAAQSRAFCSDGEGAITITVCGTATEELVAEVSYTGFWSVGSSAEAADAEGAGATRSFEIDLVEALCEQIGGTLQTGSTESGEYARVTVPVLPGK